MDTTENILVLIRHGEAKGHDQGLSELGIMQTEEASALVETLFPKKYTLKHLICSNGPCAREGAQIIGKRIEATPLVVDGQAAIGLIESSIEMFPGELPKVIITRGKFIRDTVPVIAKYFHCKNPLDDDALPDKGIAYAIICDFDKKTIERVAF